MTDDLVERVARVICCTNGQCYRPDKCFSWSFTGEATAAIAVALEEAARVVEFSHDSHTAREVQLMLDKAAAIRALIPKERA